MLYFHVRAGSLFSCLLYCSFFHICTHAGACLSVQFCIVFKDKREKGDNNKGSYKDFTPTEFRLTSLTLTSDVTRGVEGGGRGGEALSRIFHIRTCIVTNG